MEITNEIKAKVFAQYLGQNFINYDNEVYRLDGILRVLEDNYILLNVEDNIELEFYLEDSKLILKHIVLISDEDAIGIGFLNALDFIEYSSIVNDGCGKLSDYQYLISKGYDLPNFHLSGKTLHEAGLCKYL